MLTNHSLLGQRGMALFRALDRRWGWARWPGAITAVGERAVAETMLAASRPVELLRNCLPGDWSVARREGPVVQVASVLRLAPRKEPGALIEASTGSWRATDASGPSRSRCCCSTMRCARG